MKCLVSAILLFTFVSASAAVRPSADQPPDAMHDPVTKPLITVTLSEGTTVIKGTALPTTNSATYNVAIVRLTEPGLYGPSPSMTLGCMTTDDLTVKEVPVAGKADGKAAAADGKVLLLSGSPNNSFVTPTDNKGNFTATLTQALYEGEQIMAVTVLPAGDHPADDSKCASNAATVSYAYDFYRTNVTFAAGVLISNSSSSSTSNSNFSQANQFYALNLDRSWRLPGVACEGNKEFGVNSGGHAGLCASPPNNSWKARKLPGINSFFETRLTAIPVSSNSASSNSTSGGTSGGTSTTTAAFLTTQKTIRVQGGAYLPWVLGHGPGTHPDGIFLAPVAKVGFDTLAGTSQVVVPTDGTTGTTTLNLQNAYNFYSFGGRVGNMKISASESRAPLVEDYLDVTMGRYSNLDSFICHSSSTSQPSNSQSLCAVDYPTLTNPVDSRKRLYRVDLEGLIRIPVPATAIPFYIGLNANIGQHSLGAAKLDHGYATPDDIRIFFGTKFDVGKLLNSFNLGGSSSTSTSTNSSN